ncbi:dienelactone hydrolase family protein [Hoeflea sp. TYP-13]|uniref:dienelactone hydrolase family protein n=1 Tax=Hoeflea sp. TYP-13 TaxID=3230023 RepID=UPI0034C6A70D
MSKPKGEGPFPAVILMHGCGGIQQSHFRWAAILNSEGYITLIPDSFRPRSIAYLCKSDVHPALHRQRILDAHGALAYLRNLPDVDSARIGIIGWSQGATMTLETISSGSILKSTEPWFRAAITFYPYCVADRRIDLPVLIMVGEVDEWSPPGPCRELASNNRPPDSIEVVTYPLAFHAFDMVEIADGFAIEGPSGIQHWLKFDPQAYQDAINRVRAFLALHLSDQ